MQELPSLTGASVQSATTSTLGCSALSAQPVNHESHQQEQHVAASAAAFDPTSKKLFAILNASEESKADGASSSLLHMSAQSHQAPIKADDPAWTFKSLDSVQGSCSSKLISNTQFRSKNEELSAVPHSHMHFDKSASMGGLTISQSGLTVSSTEKSQKAVCNIAMTEGVHYWEIMCPMRLHGLLFGVTTKGDNPITVTQTFHSSTERVVGVELNLTTLEIRYFIQSRYCKKNKCKKLVYKDKPASGLEWYPYVEFVESGNTVTLNPFRVSPIPETTSVQQMSKVPETLGFDLTHTKVALLEQIIGNSMLVHHKHPEASLFDLKAEAEKLSDLPVLNYTSQHLATEDKNTTTYQLVKTESWADLITATRIFKKEFPYQVVGPRTLAKTLLSHYVAKVAESYSCAEVKAFNKSALFISWLVEQFDADSIISHLQPKDAKDEHKSLLELLASGQIKAQNSAAHASPQVACTAQGKVIVANDSEVKLMSQTADMSLFSNYPTTAKDNVFINVNGKDLHFLVKNSGATEMALLAPFFAQVADTFDGQRAKVSYVDALFAVQTLMKASVNQYHQAEQLANQVTINDTCKSQNVKKVAGSTEATLSFTELNLLLSICVDLEDQLWAMTQAPQVPSKVRDLWPQAMARNHTAYGRAASMVDVADEQNPMKLAELGLINEIHKSRFMHYQDPAVPIEGVYEPNLVSSLEKQLPNSALLKGLSTYNVKLDQTLNALPPAQHMNGLPSKQELPQTSAVDQLATVGNFVLTGNKANASVNLFSTQMGLTRTLQHSFIKQKHQDIESVQPLAHTKFTNVYENTHVKVMSKRATPKQPALFSESDLKESSSSPSETQAESVQENEEALFGAMFDVTAMQKTGENEVVDSDTSDEEFYDEISKPKSFSQAWLTLSAPAAPAKADAPAKVSPTASKPKEDAKLDAVKAKLKTELMNMSFTNNQIEAAFKLAKQFKVEEMVDIICNLPAEEKPKSEAATPKADEGIVTWLPYNCAECTFRNEENPAANCSICGGKAPDSAKVIKISEQQQAANAKKQKEEDEAKKAKDREERKEAEEQKKQQLLQEQLAQCHDYYEQAEVTKYFCASVMGGQSIKPVLFGACLQGKGHVDIHVKGAKYRRSFIHDFFGGDKEFFLEELRDRQTAIEAILPATMLQKNKQEVMRTQSLAVCRANLETTACVFQVSDNITETQKMHIVVSGKKDGKPVTVVFSIDHKFAITTETITAFDNLEVSAAVSHGNKVLIQSNDKLHLFDLSFDETLKFVQEQEFALKAGEKLLGISNGVASVQADQSIRTFDISARVEQKQVQTDNTQGVTISKQDPNSVMAMSIDPSKITVDDLDRFERMMLGDGALASSNSAVVNKNEVRQTWQSWEDTPVVGPLDMKLAQPTNLIQLNIDVQFKCNNLNELVQSIGKQEGAQAPVVEQKSDQTIISTTENQPVSSVAKKLGLFSMKAFSDEASAQSESKVDNKYLPLIVKRNKGSCYNNQLLPSRMLVDNDWMFASNYAKPEIVFSHTDDSRMMVEKVTIRTQTSSKTGAYPLGEGMIFLSDTMQPLEQIDAFSKFTYKQYQDWKTERVKDLRPMRNNEPVAYFQFDEKVQITFELDVKRPARYILLVPTGFRQKPMAFIQNVEQVPMEVQFFGVSGSVVQSEERALDQVEISNPAQNLALNINSGFDVCVEIKNKHESFSFTIEDAQIDQLMCADKSISAETLLANQAVIASNMKAEGQSIIRISDSRLQLQSIESVQVFLKAKNATASRQWDVVYTSVECIQAKVSNQAKADEPLFSNTDISACHYRSCLLDPLYFNVVNKQIVSITSNIKVSQRLRSRAIQFLTRIVHKDARIHALVLKEINLADFLNANMFGINQDSMIPIAAELLQSFQSDVTFLQNLYQILIKQVEKLPHEIISYHGYEALIGILKWALPLDVESTLHVLLETLCKKVLAKIAQGQKQEHILYRTRFQQDSDAKCAYPYDTQRFEPISAAETNSSSDNKASATQLKKRDDLIHEVQLESSVSKSSSPLVHTMKLKFFAEAQLSMMKLYFAKPTKEGGSYLITVSISNKGKLVYSHQFPMYTFHQCVVLPYEPKADQTSDHALTINSLNILTQELQVTIQFNSLNSAVDTKAHEQVSNVFIESYGKIQEHKRAEALVFYDNVLKQVSQDNKNKPTNVNKSYMCYILSDKSSKEPKYLPVMPPQEKLAEPVADKKDSVAESKEQQVQSSEKDMSELRKLQKVLDEATKSNNLPKAELQDLTNKICKAQSPGNVAAGKPENCMQYLMTVACDLSKLISHIKAKGGIEVNPFLAKVCPDFPAFCLEFFTHMIVNESGQQHIDSINFFKDCLLEVLSADQKHKFVCTIIDTFLSKSIGHISQRAVIDATVMLGVSDKVLIQYMADKLKPYMEDKQAANQDMQSPITMMFSVLALALSSYEQLQSIPVVNDREAPKAEEGMTHDQQYMKLFYVSLWVCENTHKLFSRPEQIALLSFLTQSMSELSKVVSFDVFVKIASDYHAMQTISIDFICFQNKKLHDNRLKALSKIIQRHEAVKADNAKHKEQLLTAAKQRLQLMQSMNMHESEVLTWLIDFKVDDSNEKEMSQNQRKLIEMCRKDQSLWLSEVNKVIDNYLHNKKLVHQMEQQILEAQKDKESAVLDDNKQQKAQEEKSLLNMIQKLIVMLKKSNDVEQQESLQQIWTLALRSLRTVSVTVLIDAKVLESMIEAFLGSNYMVQQTTFTQILRISESIASNDKNGRFVCKLLFNTLDSVKNKKYATKQAEQVVVSICQGWLDILTLGHIGANTKSPLAEQRLDDNSIYATLEAEDVMEIMKQAAEYMSKHLNQGNFEGASGANPMIVMRMQIVSDMLMICKRAQSTVSKRAAIVDLYTQCQTDKQVRATMQTAFDQLISWLFLSGRLDDEEKELVPLGSTSLNTPATILAKQITQQLQSLLELVSDCHANTEVIQLAMSSLTEVVRSMNQSINSRSISDKMSFFVGIKLTKRTNALFTKLIGHWLVSDSLVEYFVFTLKGFDFLLDTISSDNKTSVAGDEESKEEKPAEEKASSLKGSDLERLFLRASEESKEGESAPTSNAVVPNTKDAPVDDNFVAPIMELAKTKFVLQETSGSEPVTNYQNCDWPVNKKAYKHKVYNKNIKDSRGYLEHEMLFKLNQQSLVREIQIGFVNYWATEAEVSIEPISVLVQGGPDKENLHHICTLEVVTDTAFLSVCSTIFAKNLQQYDSEAGQVASSISDMIKAKLDSIPNFKIQWIKFSMRRNVFTCIENSPLAARLQKTQMLSINYISMSGYDLTQIKSSSSAFIAKEQKKSALQVMSQICSGEFSSVLKVIANQANTISKIKNQFDLLASLVDDKSSMIEPTFVSIATHNAEMGDWIIKRFMETAGFEKHAALCGKIIICDIEKAVDRLQVLLLKIFEILTQINNATTGQATLATKISPFIDIYIKTIHLVAPELSSKNKDRVIDLNVSQQQITDNLIQHISEVNTGYNSAYLFRVTHFLALVMSPPLPFVNKAVEQESFAKMLMTEVQGLSEDAHQSRYHVASLLASQNSDIAKNILDSMSSQITDGMLAWRNPKQINNKAAVRWATFWINCIADERVKARFQSDNLPVQLYNLLKEDDPKGMETRIIKEYNEEYLVLIVELILRISAGHKALEEELTKTVIKDLDTLRTKRDMYFINKVLLPLIRNEMTVPVCIIDRRKETDGHVNMDSLSVGGSADKASKQDHSKFLPSDLIDSDQRTNIVKAFKEIVGKVSSNTCSSHLQQSWSLAKTITQEQQVGEFPDLWNSIQHKGPMFMLIKGKNMDGDRYLFGGYCSKPMPAAPEYFDSDTDLPVNSAPEDFLFVHLPGEGYFFFQPKNNIILEFFTDYESGGAISMGSDFMQISMSYDFRLSVGNISNLNELTLNSVPRSKSGPINGLKQFTGLLSGDQNKVFQVERAEIWIGNSAGSKTPSVSFANQSKVGRISKVLSQVQMPFQQGVDTHPWLSALSPQNFYRSRRVFFVPAHLTVKKAAEILLHLNSEQSAVALTSDKTGEFEKTDSMQSVYDKFMSDKKQAEAYHNILDLNFITEALTDDVLIEEDPADIVSHVQSNYMPKNGFFDQFESQGGVKQFIAVTLASLTWWKDQKVAESWRLWLKEIDSFSEIPLFFQNFLKNKACKDLLFKVLSGEPDKNVDSAKWEQEQRDAVQVNYKILAEIFGHTNDFNIRQTAIKAGFLERILERLGAVSGEKPRIYEDSESEDEEDLKGGDLPSLEKKASSIEEKNKTRAKRSGVGYSSKQGETFNVNAYLENKKQRNDQIKILIDICCNFFTSDEWIADKEVMQIILESPLLPLLESAFRNGSWLDMAKEAPVYHSYMALTRALASQENLTGCLIEIDKKYKPVQTQPIHVLLTKLNDLASIFLQCLNQQQNNGNGDQSPEKLARDVTKTFTAVQTAIEEILANKQGDDAIKDALLLPTDLQYRALLQTLRFDYMDMKQGETDYKHHYKGLANQNQSPPQDKMVRLAQELADLSNALPSEHTNAVFVRVDKSRVDMMKSIITGATGTPYAHGCYEFDIFCENNYPNGPPKMNLMTTGNGQIRFNPNLYACGKVCLSLLGTWRGNATENWDAKLSTILQVLLSTQAIIMSEEVYFNEPGFENEAGTVDGEKRNEGYMNIVRYGNVKYAMLGQIKKPSKGFESAILRHFYVKKAEILTDVHKWVERADKVDSLFTGLVSDHNHNIAKDFQKSKTKYREMLQAVVKELEDELHKLDKPQNYQIKPKAIVQKKAAKQKQVGISEGKVDLDTVDMGSDDESKTTTIDTTKQNIDVDDEAVKDRWSRYIGAMGVEAVAKQSKAQIFLSGAGSVGIEIAKNLVLSGCKSFTFHDTKATESTDLSAQFFLNSADLGKNRVEACLHRLQQLNFYVKCLAAPQKEIPLTEAELTAEPWNLQKYDVVILTEASYKTQIAVNNFCRKNGKKFMSTDVYGVFGRVFNDFGDNFEVLDKNGEELQDCMIKNISIDGEKALVELIDNAKHKFADNDECHFVGIEGMELLEGKSQNEENKDVKSGSINETIWKVKTVSPYSFTIGDTSMYKPYQAQGIAKQLRTKLTMKFKSFEETMAQEKDAPFDLNLAVADFEKLSHGQVCHHAFAALDAFKEKNGNKMPAAWSVKDALAFMEIAKSFNKDWSKEDAKWDDIKADMKLLMQFVFTATGVFNPLCAFFGGFVAQECVKAITGKFSPTQQVFYYDAIEVLPSFELKEEHLKVGDSFEETIKALKTDSDKSRADGLRVCIGQEMVEKLAHAKLFMVGAGAIGCELLKNYAMLGVGTGKATKDKAAGQIVLTDPDVIEVSNLNRQFLFREKHLRKPKSQTAAAAAIYMNPDLKGNIIARLDKVFEGTNHIFTDKFFEDQTIVTNALDNIMARKYIDARCVTAKTALLESGTLGPKGHVQVILPYKTETYGQQQDPEESSEIPVCTMKMFPEETLHCVEWAREKFGRMFTQLPQSAIKLLEEGDKFQADSQQDQVVLKEGMRLLKKRPSTFMDCIEHARMKFEKLFNHDIKQLLHVYPLDHKTKEGNAFWTLPKRPPMPAVFDKKNPLHRMMVTSLACLRANVFFIEIPSKSPRSEEFRMEVAENASFFKPAEFVPNDAKAKEIQDSVNKADKSKEEEEKKDDKEESSTAQVDEVEKAKTDFLTLLKTIKIDKAKSIEDTLIRKEEFEKDNDANFHIDFMYSMANCRSQNYKLDEMDWLTVKLKAGRIVPALATTTAAIAGLQALEMVKCIKGIKKEDFRNIFLNLAVPIMQAGEPGDVKKEKLLDDLTFSIWDSWEVKDFKKGNLKAFMSKIEEMHPGLEVRDVMKGNMHLYIHAIQKANEALQKKTLETTLRALADSESEPYVDLAINVVKKGDEEQKLMAGPPVRVRF